MGMGGDRNYFSWTNWNWTIVLRFPKAGNGIMGMETKSWEWEGMGTQKSFPHISSQNPPLVRLKKREEKTIILTATTDRLE